MKCLGAILLVLAFTQMAAAQADKELADAFWTCRDIRKQQIRPGEPQPTDWPKGYESCAKVVAEYNRVLQLRRAETAQQKQKALDAFLKKLPQ